MRKGRFSHPRNHPRRRLTPWGAHAILLSVAAFRSRRPRKRRCQGCEKGEGGGSLSPAFFYPLFLSSSLNLGYSKETPPVSGRDEGHAYLAQARQDVLDGLIDGALIEQGAAALGISLAEDELEGQVEADIAAGGGQAAFEEWLQSTGQTREDYKEMLRQSLLAQRVLDSVSADVGADAEQVHVRLIMVDSEEAAQQILALLQQGGDFAALVREHSLDLATKENGGDLGWFPRGLVAPELETAAFSLQPGQVSGVVRLGDGYHIIQVIEREAARPLSPELQLDLKLSFFEEWLAGQRASALIERYVGE